MKFFCCACLIACLMAPLACSKKSDADLFQEGPIRVNLTADRRQGYEPLFVSFSAYLETEDRTVREEITEVKWIITGTRGFYREIVQEAYNYQDVSDNKEDFFFLDFDFKSFGKYKVRLVLNDGQFASRAIPIFVIEDLSRRR